MSVNILQYFTSIASYLFDCFAIFYDIGMTPLSDFLLGTFEISYTNPFSDVVVNASYVFVYDIPFIGDLFEIISGVFKAILDAIPFIGDISTMPTIFVLFGFAGFISVAYYIWQVIVG